MKVSCVFIVLILMTQQISFSQLNVSTGQSPQWYVQNVLLGGGVQISNVTYTGSPNSIGHFTTGSSPTNLGLTEGLILSTGVVNGSPPIGSPVGNFASTDLGLPGSSLLNSLIPGYSTYDAIILEFDFIPLADTIKFRYVFASEEYPEWVGSSYNDVFGFFISGPNPLGGNYNNHNIALIPNTTLPVSINNVNQNSYTQYYVNNEAMNGQTIVFDGFTTVFTAFARVVPCQTYHIKIAIADAGDGIYDSAVFLEANSFSSNAITINTSYSLSNSIGYAIEGCNHPTVSFCLPSPATTDVTFSINISGTATYGVDYSSIPTTYTIPAGQQCISQPIQVFNDNISEGSETIIISTITGCGSMSSATIYIHDYVPLSLTTSGNTTICNGAQTTISVNPFNGLSPYNYTWSHGLPSAPSHIVSPSTSTTYNVTVTDLCNFSASSSIVINVDHVTISASASPSIICIGQSAHLTASGANAYSWSHGLGSGNFIEVSPISTTTYSVTGTNTSTGCSGTAQVTVTVNPLPNITASASPSEICLGQSSMLSASGANTYIWNQGLGIGSTHIVSPSSTTTYTVTGTHTSTGCSNTAQVSITVHALPQVTLSASLNPICMGQTTTLTANGAQHYNWNNNLGNGNTHTVQPTTTTTYTVTGTDNITGCSNTAQLIITVYSLPNVILTASESSICIGQSTTLFASGALEYSWSHNLSNNSSHTVSPITTTTYVVTGTDANQCSDTASITILVHPLPDVIVYASPSYICQGQSSTLYAQGADYYMWNNNLNNSPLHLITPSTTTTYSVTGTNQSTGCSNSAQVTVVVYPLPQVEIQAAYQTICEGDSLTLIATGASSYFWNNNLPPGSQHTVSPTSTTTYAVTGTDAYGCSSSTQITINVVPDPVVTIEASSTEICSGEPVTLTAHGANTYLWSTGNDAQTLTLTPSSSTTFFVTGYVTNDCSSSAYVTIIVYPRPQADFNYRYIEGFSEFITDFYDLSNGNPVFWHWDFDDGTTSNHQHPTHYYPLLTHTYYVTLHIENEYGCSDQITKPVSFIYFPDYTLYIPNAFSPNQDGKNDFFSIFYTNISNNNFNFWIFDRWGNIIYHSNDPSFKWDGYIAGKVAPEDVYVYKVEFVDAHNKKHTKHGFIYVNH